LELYEAIVRTLSGKPHEGNELFDAVERMTEAPITIEEWRRAIISLEAQGAIVRIVVRDDDEKVVEVNYDLSEKNALSGEDHERGIRQNDT
jgi:hypothetical protein